MNAHSNKAFYYHAHATSLGGTLRQPVQKVVSTDASVSLASAGGFSSQRIGPFHVDGLVSVKAAHVRVSGSEHGTEYRPEEHGDRSGATPAAAGQDRRETRSWRTTTTAIVEGLNILEVVTADRIVAQVSVDHPRHGRTTDAKVTLLGSRFDNLRVHGSLVEPELNRKMFGARGGVSVPAAAVDNSPLAFKELIEAAKEQHGTRKSKHGSHAVHPRLTQEDPATDLEQKGSALCSLVETVKPVAEPVTIYSHMLQIPDFGNVFLGELLVGHFSAQLTMLRVEMGCMADGDLSACSVYTNGRTMP